MHNHREKAVSLILLTILLTAAALSSVTESKAQGVDQWTFKIQTEELKQLFSYKGTKLNPVAKVVVDYKKTREIEYPYEYESFWCHDGHPLGFEKKGPYRLKRGDLVHVDVKQKVYSEEENKAAAFAIMRVGLATLQNYNGIVAITLPARTFDSVCDEMRQRKCEDVIQEANKATPPGVLFTFDSEPPGMNQKLLYRTKK